MSRRLTLTHAEYEALLEAVTLLDAELSGGDDDSGAERQRQVLDSAWRKIQGDARAPGGAEGRQVEEGKD